MGFSLSSEDCEQSFELKIPLRQTLLFTINLEFIQNVFTTLVKTIECALCSVIQILKVDLKKTLLTDKILMK